MEAWIHERPREAIRKCTTFTTLYKMYNIVATAGESQGIIVHGEKLKLVPCGRVTVQEKFIRDYTGFLFLLSWEFNLSCLIGSLL